MTIKGEERTDDFIFIYVPWAAPEVAGGSASGVAE